MRARLRGINTIRRKLASGVTETYYYHRGSGERLKGTPGSPTFLACIADAEAKMRTRDNGTLNGVVREFQETAKYRRLAESTKKEYRRIFTFWSDEFGTCPLTGLEDKAFRRDVLKWHDAYSAKNPREADNRVTILARVLSWAASDGPLDRNVLDKFERAYKSDRSEMIWLPEHVNAFLAVAEPEMKLAMVLALHTGLRQGDILRLTWHNYDGQRITVTPGKSKREGGKGKQLPIPCTTALKTTLDGLTKRSPLILTTKTGRAFKKRYFADQWEKTCKAAGIENLHFHDIRGTTVTMLFRGGCDVAKVASITGHSLRRAQDILDKYLARTGDMAESAIAKLENVLETDFAKQTAKREVANHAK